VPTLGLFIYTGAFEINLVAIYKRRGDKKAYIKFSLMRFSANSVIFKNLLYSIFGDGNGMPILWRK